MPSFSSRSSAQSSVLPLSRRSPLISSLAPAPVSSTIDMSSSGLSNERPGAGPSRGTYDPTRAARGRGAWPTWETGAAPSMPLHSHSHPSSPSSSTRRSHLSPLLSRLPLRLRLRSRPALLILLLILLWLTYRAHSALIRLLDLRTIEPLHKHNALLFYLPALLHPYVRRYVPTGSGLPSALQPVPELLGATWAGSWAVPELRGGNRARVTVTVGHAAAVPTHEEAPAWVSIYIFSTSSGRSRARRDLIRMHHPTLALPEAYRHLVDVRFVLGYPEARERDREELRELEAGERDVEREMERYGDVVRLRGLKGGDNINEGKTWEWVRWVGNHGREAQWVFKCDDDTVLAIPNLLDELLKLDPARPTYMGSSMGRWTGYHYYFGGMFYGFNWGVVRTLATAPLSREMMEAHRDEDAFMGEMLHLLPSKPPCPHPPPTSYLAPALSLFPSHSSTCLLPATRKHHTWDTPPPGVRASELGPGAGAGSGAAGRKAYGGIPLNPDRRTGLYRHDLLWRAGDSGRWYLAKEGEGIAWHWTKQDEEWLYWHDRIKTWHEQHRGGYMWEPPKSMRHLAKHV